MPLPIKSSVRRQHSHAFHILQGLVIAGVLWVVTVVVLLRLVGSEQTASGNKIGAMNDLQQVVTAIRGFEVEYGHFPEGGQTLNGDREFSGANEKDLLNILRNHESGATRQNQRNVVFFEGFIIKPASRLKRGLGPDGTFYDPWGRPYFFAMDADGDGSVTVPLAWHAADSGKKLSTNVIGFSPGKDAHQKDDITTW